MFFLICLSKTEGLASDVLERRFAELIAAFNLRSRVAYTYCESQRIPSP